MRLLPTRRAFVSALAALAPLAALVSAAPVQGACGGCYPSTVTPQLAAGPSCLSFSDEVPGNDCTPAPTFLLTNACTAAFVTDGGALIVKAGASATISTRDTDVSLDENGDLSLVGVVGTTPVTITLEEGEGS